jgi:hypothetical protein
MTQRARACGLAFEPERLQARRGIADPERRRVGAELVPDPLGALHDSRKGVYRLLPGRPRTVRDDRPARSALSSTAVRRLQESPDYARTDLEQYLAAGGPTTYVQVDARAPAQPREPV